MNLAKLQGTRSLWKNLYFHIFIINKIKFQNDTIYNIKIYI